VSGKPGAGQRATALGIGWCAAVAVAPGTARRAVLRRTPSEFVRETAGLRADPQARAGHEQPPSGAGGARLAQGTRLRNRVRARERGCRALQSRALTLVAYTCAVTQARLRQARGRQSAMDGDAGADDLGPSEVNTTKVPHPPRAHGCAGKGFARASFFLLLPPLSARNHARPRISSRSTRISSLSRTTARATTITMSVPCSLTVHSRTAFSSATLR